MMENYNLFSRKWYKISNFSLSIIEELYFGDEPYKNTVQLRGVGGRGGGAIKVTSRHVIVDGAISANGEATAFDGAGECATFKIYPLILCIKK